MIYLRPENIFTASSVWKFDQYICTFTCAFSFDLLTGQILDDPGITLIPPEDMQNLYVLKPRAEFYLAARAYAPQGRPVPALRVLARIGQVSKELFVFGDRYWKRRGGINVISDPVPFKEMEICWENAFGGQGFPLNPLGKGLGPSETDKEGGAWPLPNIESPGRIISSPKDRPEPVSFRPYGPAWPQRSKMLGTFDNRWIEKRWPWFPEDFDPSYFNAAPKDQQFAGLLNGTEEMVFENMHPERPVLRAEMPGMKIRAFYTRQAREGEELLFSEVPLRLDTIWVIPHLEVAILAWHGAVETTGEFAEDIAHFMAILEPVSRDSEGLEQYHSLFLQMLKEAEGLEEEEEEEEEGPLLLEEEPGPKEKPEENEEEKDEGTGEDVGEEIRWQGKGEKESAAELLKRLQEELKETEKELSARLEEIGIDPKTYFAGTGAAGTAEGEKAPSSKELIAALRAIGVRDPSLEEHLLSLEKESLKAEEELRRIEDERSKEAAALMEATPVPDSADEVEMEGPEPWTRDRVMDHHRAGGGFRGADLSGLDLSGLDLKGADFQEADLTGTVFKGTELDGADFSLAELISADFSSSSLKGACLAGANAHEALFLEADLGKADLRGGVFSGADFSAALLTEALLDEADLSGSIFSASHLQSCSANGADFSGASISASHFEQANLVQADFSDSRIEETDFSLSQASNSYFYGTSGRDVLFRGADLSASRADEETKWTGTDFSGANLAGACWQGTTFQEAIFKESCLERANLSESRFTNTLFYHCNARYSVMDRASFVETRLTACDFLQSRFEASIFSRVDLRGTNLFEAEFWKLQAEGCEWELANVGRTKLAGKVRT